VTEYQGVRVGHKSNYPSWLFTNEDSEGHSLVDEVVAVISYIEASPGTMMFVG
jgi:hypothetical protein